MEGATWRHGECERAVRGADPSASLATAAWAKAQHVATADRTTCPVEDVSAGTRSA